MLLWSCEERDGMLQTDGREGREGRVRLRRSSASKAAGILLKPAGKKSPELANAQTAGIFPATQPPRGLRSTTTPAESPAPPVLPGLTFEHGKLVRKVSVWLYWPCKHCNVCTLQCLYFAMFAQGIEINFIRKNEEEEKLNNEECWDGHHLLSFSWYFYRGWDLSLGMSAWGVRIIHIP